MKYPKSIQNLIDMLTRLPSVGPKTAERYVFYLFKQNPEVLQQFAQAIAELKEKTVICKHCHVISESDPCPICSNNNRLSSTICVVSDTRNMLAIESTGEYMGLYHILGGVINTIRGVKPENLNILTLVSRIKKSNVKEVILALNPNLEGETTAMHLIKILKPLNIKISRLAKGLPMGAELEYADEITLASAIKNRNIL